jgi:hypothetical protein
MFHALVSMRQGSAQPFSTIEFWIKEPDSDRAGLEHGTDACERGDDFDRLLKRLQEK